MNSFFAKVDTAENPQNVFWKPVEENWKAEVESYKVHEGYLRSLKDRNPWKYSYYVLTKTYIYKFRVTNRLVAQAPHKACFISWKFVGAYSEENYHEVFYGFRLFMGDTFNDFYTANSAELDTWMAKLSNLAILTDFEEDFELLNEIGKGTNSSVYLSRSKSDNIQYAVKSIRKKAVNNCNSAQRAMIDEISIMRKLNHPRIVKLHKVYESETHIYLVMDYLRGNDLHHRICKQGTFSEETAAKLTRNILETLDYIHSVNIVHRDIKPENIMMINLLDDSDFKLGDFGIATQAHENLKLVCGSPRYIAPEILREEVYGAKVDIFSLGIVVYILLSGSLPFGNNGATQNFVLNHNKKCRLVFREAVWTNISREALDFVLKLTGKNPLERPTAKEALAHPWLNMVHLPKPLSCLPLTPDSNMNQSSRRMSDALLERISKTKRKSAISYDRNSEDPNSKLTLASFLINSKTSTVQSHRILVELRNNDTSFRPKFSFLKSTRRKSESSPLFRIESPQQINKTQANFYLSFSEALEQVSSRGIRIGGSPNAKRTSLYVS